MKKTILLMMMSALLAISVNTSAARQPVPRIYMFGVAAAFTDTIVHFTDIQEVDSAWINTKNNFLLERQAYSYQLRDYLDQIMQMPHRTCIVFYSLKKEKLEKKYQKMMNLYTKSKDGKAHFDLRQLDKEHFRFRTVSSTPDLEESPQ
ncbi:MAG: hypothetical protein K5683_03905 [Prevotella sp.]|nr:hypothetical protein [Prevotella sp.]